jgi:hypothetical protein
MMIIVLIGASGERVLRSEPGPIKIHCEANENLTGAGKIVV